MCPEGTTGHTLRNSYSVASLVSYWAGREPRLTETDSPITVVRQRNSGEALQDESLRLRETKLPLLTDFQTESLVKHADVSKVTTDFECMVQSSYTQFDACAGGVRARQRALVSSMAETQARLDKLVQDTRQRTRAAERDAESLVVCEKLSNSAQDAYAQCQHVIDLFVRIDARLPPHESIGDASEHYDLLAPLVAPSRVALRPEHGETEEAMQVTAEDSEEQTHAITTIEPDNLSPETLQPEESFALQPSESVSSDSSDLAETPPRKRANLTLRPPPFTTRVLAPISQWCSPAVPLTSAGAPTVEIEDVTAMANQNAAIIEQTEGNMYDDARDDEVQYRDTAERRISLPRLERDHLSTRSIGIVSSSDVGFNAGRSPQRHSSSGLGATSILSSFGRAARWRLWSAVDQGGVLETESSAQDDAPTQDSAAHRLRKISDSFDQSQPHRT
ncbi:hypothetical protein PYCC9005_000336 [Savitreella phatthalungensis]